VETMKTEGDVRKGPHRSIVRKLLIAAGVAVLLVVGIHCATVPTSGPLAEDQIDDQAMDALTSMCKTLEEAKAFSFHVDARFDRPREGLERTITARSSEVLAVKPDRLSIKTQTDDGDWAAWYDGRKLALLDKKSNEYATEAAPNTIEKMLDWMHDDYGVVMPMADLLVGNTYGSLTANVESGEYLGVASVGDRECHHLLFTQATIDWQIWIEKGDQALPRKLVITKKLERGQPQYDATMSKWNLAPEIPAEAFKFVAPAEGKSVDLADLVGTEEGDAE
jgi:hypothetical protein